MISFLIAGALGAALTAATVAAHKWFHARDPNYILEQSAAVPDGSAEEAGYDRPQQQKHAHLEQGYDPVAIVAVVGPEGFREEVRGLTDSLHISGHRIVVQDGLTEGQTVWGVVIHNGMDDYFDALYMAQHRARQVVDGRAPWIVVA